MSLVFYELILIVCPMMLQLSHGGIIMLKNVKPDEEEDLVEFVAGLLRRTQNTFHIDTQLFLGQHAVLPKFHEIIKVLP